MEETSVLIRISAYLGNMYKLSTNVFIDSSVKGIIKRHNNLKTCFVFGECFFKN